MRRLSRCLAVLAAANLIGAASSLGAEDALRSSVVRIEVTKLVTRKTSAGNFKTAPESWMGSGFWIVGTNRIVTCAHVLEGARQVSVYGYSQWQNKKPWTSERGQISLCLSDPTRDLAIIEVPETGGNLPLAMATQSGDHIGITSVGHTEGYPWRVNYGQLTGVIPAKQLNISIAGDVLVCDVSFGPGSSGGIVVDKDNRILGMIEGGKEGGKYGTRIAIPCTAIRQALQSTSATACHGPVIEAGAPIVADEDTYADLIPITRGGPDNPAGLWGEISFGYLSGVDRFDDHVPSWRLDGFKSVTNRRSWCLAAELGQRTVHRVLESGPQVVTDTARMRRLAVTAGPRLLVKEFGHASIYSTARVGYVHDRVDHDYTFSSPLFAPQSYERPVSGVLGVWSADVELSIITNLRIGWSGELWQGSGGIGNGLTNRFGVRVGVGRGHI